MADPTEVRAALERVTLLAPFRHLTRGFFAGRERELAVLQRYVSGGAAASNATRPIFIHGPGGMGKSSVLAHFILSYSEREPHAPLTWRPFVYLDFDRPDLDASNPATVLVAILKQIRWQVPAVHLKSERLLEHWAQIFKRQGRQDWTRSRRARPKVALRTSVVSLDKLVDELASVLQAAGDTSRCTIPLVLDTLEEVQYATPDAVWPLVDLVVSLRTRVPALRPILAGRAELGNAFDDDEVDIEQLRLGPLPPDAAASLLRHVLPPFIASREDVVRSAVRAVGGNPLSLKLAAEVLTRETAGCEADSFSFGAELRTRVDDAIVQGRLYERILGHIHDVEVRKLAYPGLVLRHVTWELIRDVLAKPCGLEVPSDARAREVFDSLANEGALVRRRSGADSLELRPELRRIVLDDFTRDHRSRATRDEIHRAAVAYYMVRSGREARAEEIYHRLSLDEPTETLESRWMDGIEPLLAGVVPELPDAARAYAANRLGILGDVAPSDAASLLEWEEWAEQRAADCLRLGLPTKALDILATRTDRTDASRLHRIESIAHRRLNPPNVTPAVDAAERGVTAARASRDPTELRDALEEAVAAYRLANDDAAVFRALAELGNLGEQLGDDLILLESGVEALEAIESGNSVGADQLQRFSDAAIRVFGRLPDELVRRAPELARRVAAQVGGSDPETLRRVVRLVGSGPLTQDAANGLVDVLRSWGSRISEVEKFIPTKLVDMGELEKAADYLVTSREVDPQTARELAVWLKRFVTPKK